MGDVNAVKNSIEEMEQSMSALSRRWEDVDMDAREHVVRQINSLIDSDGFKYLRRFLTEDSIKLAGRVMQFGEPGVVLARFQKEFLGEVDEMWEGIRADFVHDLEMAKADWEEEMEMLRMEDPIENIRQENREYAMSFRRPPAPRLPPPPIVPRRVSPRPPLNPAERYDHAREYVAQEVGGLAEVTRRAAKALKGVVGQSFPQPPPSRSLSQSSPLHTPEPSDLRHVTTLLEHGTGMDKALDRAVKKAIGEYKSFSADRSSSTSSNHHDSLPRCLARCRAVDGPVSNSCREASSRTSCSSQCPVSTCLVYSAVIPTVWEYTTPEQFRSASHVTAVRILYDSC
jgi:hypothetical protein